MSGGVLVALESFQHVERARVSGRGRRARRAVRTMAAAAQEQHRRVGCADRAAQLVEKSGIARAVGIGVPFDQHAAGHAADVIPFGARAHVDQPRRGVGLEQGLALRPASRRRNRAATRRPHGVARRQHRFGLAHGERPPGRPRPPAASRMAWPGSIWNDLDHRKSIARRGRGRGMLAGAPHHSMAGRPAGINLVQSTAFSAGRTANPCSARCEPRRLMA